MKKFFGLKMTLAALAVVSFASCYDSESGDVIIPNATTVNWPAPVYVVNGTVTNFDSGAVLADVAVGGAITQTTDANGAFSVTLTSPANGDVTFTKEGFFKASRTLNMASLTTGNAVYTLNTSMISLNSPNLAAALGEKDVTSAEWPAEAEAKSITAFEDAGYGKYMTNNSDEEVSFSFYASELGYDLPYGVVASAAKATGQELFVQWVKSVYGNDPYEGFGKYWGMLTATVPAKFAVSKISVTPIKVSKTVIFPLEDGDFEQAVDMVETYIVKVDGTSLAHDHGHGHGTETNAGGGSGE